MRPYSKYPPDTFRFTRLVCLLFGHKWQPPVSLPVCRRCLARKGAS